MIQRKIESCFILFNTCLYYSLLISLYGLSPCQDLPNVLHVIQLNRERISVERNVLDKKYTGTDSRAVVSS